MSAFHLKTGVDILRVEPVSKVRNGSAQDGQGEKLVDCAIGLYTEGKFDELNEMHEDGHKFRDAT